MMTILRAIYAISLACITISLHAFTGGDGSPENPYQVSSRADLEAVNAAPLAHYILVNDISLADVTYVGPLVGTFGGVFDGNGHSIQSFQLNVPSILVSFLGLFSEISETGVVKGLQLEYLSIETTSLGPIGGLTGSNKGQIIHCTVSGSINLGRSVQQAGGLCGRNTGQIINSASSCVIRAGENSEQIGGLCGIMASGSIINSKFSGSIVVENSREIGGVCGKISGACLIENSISTGNMTALGQSYYVGGICGYNDGGWVDNCYASGMISGKIVGGICGKLDNYSRQGGFPERIFNCYSTASLSGGTLGGICGYAIDVERVMGCFWNVEASGVTTSYGGSGKTTLEMLNSNTFKNAGWDIDVVWYCSSGYPTLRWEDAPQAGPHTVIFHAGTHGQITSGPSTQLVPHTLNAVSPKVSADSGWAFMGWTPALTGIVEDTTLTAVYEQWQGEGTADNPYLVTSRQHLEGINRNLAAHYRLANDLDLTGVEYGQSVIADAQSDPAFTGSFDGAGYIIRNLTINRLVGSDNYDHVGLFGDLGNGSAVRNLRIEGAKVYCREWGGSEYLHGGGSIGILAGLASAADIRNCSVEGEVLGEENVGLLAGSVTGGAILQCFTEGRVDGRWKVGGLVGRASSEIIDCFSFADVLSDPLGQTQGYGGGLLGEIYGGSVVRCLAVGTVNRGGSLGGLVGGYQGGVVENSFWDTDVSGLTLSASGVGETTVELQTQSTFTDVNWDFSAETGPWKMSPVDSKYGGYPMLVWQDAGEVLVLRTVTLLPGDFGTITEANDGLNYVDTILPLRPFPAITVVPITDYVFTGFSPPLPDTVTRDFTAIAQYKRILPGTGTEAEPYRIRNRNDFDVFAADSTYWAAGLFILLEADIDLADTVYDVAVIAPDTDVAEVAFNGIPFGAVFDGNGFSIKNLKIDAGTQNNVALFGQLESGGIVKGLGIENAEVSGGDYLGILCGNNRGMLIDCVVTNGTLNGGSYIGILCGVNGAFLLPGSIAGCHVVGGSVTGIYGVGGFCGLNGTGSILESSATTSVTGSESKVGGFCGHNAASISKCFSRSSVAGTATYIGGFCGLNGTGRAITDCFSVGTVTANNAGGFCGWNDGTLTSCYAMGRIVGSSSRGFCRTNTRTITNCFWNTETSGTLVSSGGTGKTTSEMQSLATFTDVGWDFTGETINGINDIWELKTFPVLKTNPIPDVTVNLHPGINGGIVGANSGQDYVTTLGYGASFPTVMIQADSGYGFKDWTPSSPDLLLVDFEATAIYAALYTVTLHPGAHGAIAESNIGVDYVMTLAEGSSFPSVSVTADADFFFTGWSLALPATVTGDFEATAMYLPTHTVTLHPGLHGSIVEANSGADYMVTLSEGSSFPSVSITPDNGFVFAGWNPVFPTTVSGDFEATATYADFSVSMVEGLDMEPAVWSAGGDAPWFLQTLVSHDGVDAVESGPVTDKQNSIMETSIAGPCTISFWWKVSSEKDWDFLEFYIDGVLQDKISGEMAWEQKNYPLDSETHTLRWRYAKDNSFTEGLDCGWVDELVVHTYPVGSFGEWLTNQGLAGDSATLLQQDRNSDGVANGFEYAFAGNLTPAGTLLSIRIVNGQPVVEIPSQEETSLPFVQIRVLCSDDLIEWTIPVAPASDTTGKPAQCDWFEITAPPDGKAFFKLGVELK